jgi:phosphate-selective porin OprO/OprP
MRWSSAFGLLLLVGLISTLPADEPTLDSLQQQIDELSRVLDEKLAEEPKSVTPTPPAAPSKPAAPSYPTAKLTGFFQADAGWFGQDAVNRITPVNGVPIGDIQDGADFRRTRLAAVGDLTRNTGYMIEMDFAFPGRPSFMDVWAEVKDTFPVGNFRIGQWRQPFSMDAMTSVRELPLLERALPFAFVPFRQIGAGLYDYNPGLDLTWAISCFRFPTDFYGGNIGDDGGYALATRWTVVPWSADNDRRLLHLGAGYVFGDPANDVVRYRNQPEFFVSETGGADVVPGGVPTNVPLFVDTGTIPADNFQLYGTELASIFGPLYFQGEAIFAHVNRSDAGSNDFWGGYAQLGYYLTGEVRPYNHKSGVLTRVDPADPLLPCYGLGAWEVVGRLSYIDLNDGDVQGNALTIWSAGLNWYLNKNLKWQLMYSRSTLDSLIVGNSNLNIYALRVQADF